MSKIVPNADLHTDLIDFVEGYRNVKEGLKISWDGSHIYISGAQSGVDMARYTLEELTYE
jgi:hypothetical protein